MVLIWFLPIFLFLIASIIFSTYVFSGAITSLVSVRALIMIAYTLRASSSLPSSRLVYLTQNTCASVVCQPSD